MAVRVGGIGRGLGVGLLAGTVWFVVEAVAAWAAGSVVPGRVALQIVALDLAVGGLAGAVLGALLPAERPMVLAVALVALYGFLRVYAPPGVLAEACYLALAGSGVVLWARVLPVRAGRSDRLLDTLHLLTLGTLALVTLDLVLDESRAGALRGLRLPLVVALVPFAVLGIDRAIAVIVSRTGARLALVIAGSLAAVVWAGRPLTTAPIEDPVVTAVPPPPGTPDIVLVSLDTTRADHLSVYGYARETSPQLARFAADALLFTQARTTAGWTLPGHASMLTGQYPSRHGARLAGGWLAGQSIDGRRHVAFPLASHHTTVTERLRDRGYATGAFVANFSYLYRDFGLAQGFQRYEDAPGLLLRVTPNVVRFVQKFRPGFCLKPYRTARDINAAALAWLDRTPRDRPAFLFLNYMEPHQPWLAEAPHDRWLRALPDWKALAVRDLYTHEVKAFTPAELDFIVANYDGQIAAMDEAFGELLAGLAARGRYENALVIVTADHGELLGEHGQVGHMGRTLYEGLLHVPMIVKFPGASPPRGRRDGPVQVLDVAPTILAAAGIPLPEDLQGQHLLRVERPSFAEEDINPFLVARYGATYDRAMRVLVDGPWKLLTTSRGERLLFDLARDPGETTDLALQEPERVAHLAARLEEHLRTLLAAKTRPAPTVN